MIIENLNILVITAFLALIAHWIGWIQGFFKKTKPLQPLPFSFMTGISAFVIFLTLYSLLPPFFAHMLLHSKWLHGSLKTIFMASFLSMLSISLFISLFFIIIHKQRVNLNNWKNDLLIAVSAYLIALPTIAFVSRVLTLINIGLFQYAGEEQVAVVYLKKALSSPLNSIIMTLSVCLFAPIIEEILFRGLLHQMLRRYLSFFYAATISSILFSVVHFSKSQGIGNIPLLGSLFVLSYYLAYIYERQNRLVAPVTLHIIFNLISTIRIISF